jgi:hypothetical protein
MHMIHARSKATAAAYAAGAMVTRSRSPPMLAVDGDGDE